MDLVVRAASDAAALTPTIRRVIRDMDATLPFYGVHTMDEAVDQSLETRRLTGTLLFAFAGAAVVLAVIGIYGMMALAVSRRIHEFGIRLALGASRGDVLSLVLRQGMRLVAVGVAVGVAGALGGTRYLGALLFGVKPNEPAVFAAVVLGLVLVAFAACLLPARKATATPPLEALRLQ
jgi:ABC-type antimicrobial peptide transport system permease subunit